MKIQKTTPDYFLDITQDVCPITFVKVRLQIEKMTSNERLDIRLSGEDPLQNVPNSVTELGHAILSIEPEPQDPLEEVNGDKKPVHRLLIEIR